MKGKRMKPESKNRPEWEDEATLKTRIGLQAWAFVQSLFVAYQQFQHENERLKQENKELNRKIMEYLKIENLRILIVDAQDKKIADLTAKLEAAERERNREVIPGIKIGPAVGSSAQGDPVTGRKSPDNIIQQQQAERIRTLESLLREANNAVALASGKKWEDLWDRIRAALPKTEDV